MMSSLSIAAEELIALSDRDYHSEKRRDVEAKLRAAVDFVDDWFTGYRDSLLAALDQHPAGGTVKEHLEGSLNVVRDEHARLVAIEEKYRTLLWTSCAHPMHAKYGDDGERQCTGADFKRGDLADLEAHHADAWLAAGAAALRALTPDELKQKLGLAPTPEGGR